MAEKIKVNWNQWFQFERYVTSNTTVGWDVINTMMENAFEHQQFPIKNPTLNWITVYAFFGYEKDADAWAKKHGVERRHVITANKHYELAKTFARVTPVFDKNWYKLNYDHLNSQIAQEIVCIREVTLGSGDPVG